MGSDSDPSVGEGLLARFIEATMADKRDSYSREDWVLSVIRLGERIYRCYRREGSLEAGVERWMVGGGQADKSLSDSTSELTVKTAHVSCLVI